MITCKKDLINTYIENDKGELRDLYLSECERFNLIINSACHTTDSEVIFTKLDKGKFGNVDHSGPDIEYLLVNYGEMKKLTLSDLKPRTKVVYEKVEFEPNEIWKAFKEHQEVSYLYVNTSDGFECLLDGVFNLAMSISQGDQLYRKVERPVEWWEDALEYVVSLSDDDIINEYDHLSESISIKVSMNRKQAQDFARIILEQEGE